MKLINIFAKKEINFTHPIKIITILVIMIPLISIISINMLNLNFGIDLIGGLEFHVKFNKFIKISEINKLLNELNLYKNKIQHYGNQTTNEMLIKIEKPSNIILKQTKYIKKYLATYSNKHNFLNISDITINKKSHDNMLLKLNINKTLKNNNFFIFNTIIENKHINIMKILRNKYNKKLKQMIAINKTKITINKKTLINKILYKQIIYKIKFSNISTIIKNALSEKFGNTTIKKISLVDSQISKKIIKDGFFAILYSLLAILIYITIRFNFLFAIGAVLALIQDVFGSILLIFIICRYDFDLPSIAAILTIIGYSVNNTIIIYDRIREKIYHNYKNIKLNNLNKDVNKSINEMLTRTINTTITTLIASTTLAILASGIIRSFALLLSTGIIFGAFSSTFTAPGIYILLHKYYTNRKFVQISTNKNISRKTKAKGVI